MLSARAVNLALRPTIQILKVRLAQLVERQPFNRRCNSLRIPSKVVLLSPFCLLSGPNPSKRGPGPPNLSLLPLPAWTPFCLLSGPNPSKRGPGPPNLSLLPLPAAGPLFAF